MSDHFRTFAPGAPTGARSSSALCAAVAAVGIFSGALVMFQLSGPPAAGATTAPAAPIAQTAKTWDLEPRWWPGSVERAERVERPALVAPSATPTVAESDLTFAKGYQLRLAARQAAARVADVAPAAEGKTGAARPAVVARNASAAGRTGAAPTTRALAAPTRIEASVERAGPSDVGSDTLAFDESHPSEHGFGSPRGVLFPNIFFGTLR